MAKWGLRVGWRGPQGIQRKRLNSVRFVLWPRRPTYGIQILFRARQHWWLLPRPINRSLKRGWWWTIKNEDVRWNSKNYSWLCWMLMSFELCQSLSSSSVYIYIQMSNGRNVVSYIRSNTLVRSRRRTFSFSWIQVRLFLAYLDWEAWSIDLQFRPRRPFGRRCRCCCSSSSSREGMCGRTSP